MKNDWSLGVVLDYRYVCTMFEESMNPRHRIFSTGFYRHKNSVVRALISYR